MDRDELGIRISKLRIAHGWSQQDLANQVSISKSQICHIENGERQPSLCVLQKLVRTLGTTYEYLLDADIEKRRVLEVGNISDNDFQVLERIISLMQNPIESET